MGQRALSLSDSACCPQVELYTTHPSVKSIIERLTKLDYRVRPPPPARTPAATD